MVVADRGEGHVAPCATREAESDGPGAFNVVGQVRWSDPGWGDSGLVMETSVVTATVALWVGDAILDDPTVADTYDPVPVRTGFGYAAADALATGDLQLLNLAAVGEDAPDA